MLKTLAIVMVAAAGGAYAGDMLAKHVTPKVPGSDKWSPQTRSNVQFGYTAGVTVVAFAVLKSALG